MNVGVLTHHWLYNFGANLQAVCTADQLTQMGHRPIFINYRPAELVDKYAQDCSELQANMHRKFVRSHLQESSICSDLESVVAVANDANLDAVVCGSDAVLRLDTSGRSDLTFPNPFWLTWCEQTKVTKTAFLAASAMGSDYTMLGHSVRQQIHQAISDASVCSLRDNWTRWMLWWCGVERNAMTFCPDPVLGNPAALPNDPESEPAKFANEQPYIAISVYQQTCDQEWMSMFKEEVNRRGYRLVLLPMPESSIDQPADLVLPLPLCPSTWYQWIINSSGYVGVRFHPIVCSLAAGIPFIAFDGYRQPMPFNGNKLVRRFLKPLRFLTKHSSKTFDVCRRAGASSRCVQWKGSASMSPAAALEKLLSRDVTEERSRKQFAKQCRDQFCATLQQALN